MTDLQILISILIAAAVTVTTRAVSFVAFRNGRTPAFITWMGKQLPPAVMTMLLVYCLKDISFASAPYGVPALLGVAVTALLHLWKKQMIISISCGTIVYMILLHLIG